MRFNLFLALLFLSTLAFAEDGTPYTPNTYSPQTKKRVPKYHYQYIDRDHTMKENFAHIGAMYAVTGGLYYITQQDIIKRGGSFDNYKHNFGKITFDHDEPFWNWMVHPYSGSHLFLYYRANGYSRIESLMMSFISSTLFEFTMEVYTEPASVQDIYQTPVFGSLLGVAVEKVSLYLLNTGNLMGRVLGHLINPTTLFWFYEGKVLVTPQYIGPKKGVEVTISF